MNRNYIHRSMTSLTRSSEEYRSVSMRRSFNKRSSWGDDQRRKKKVGYDTCDHSDDRILQQDMPPALQRVEGSSKLLEESSYSLKHDPYSVPARKKLIDGARGILQGTSALLLCFDESEVRKIIRICRKVNDYVAVSEVIESMADLQQFVKDISPVLHDVTNDVNLRQQELTHQVHREILIRCLDSIKTIAPVLICSMKTSIELGTPIHVKDMLKPWPIETL
ncbi:hypothetical protein B9Z55_013705 [Caenorhabditis nigoni]|uniref:Vinculin n=2 Tax=Caenorhabditis nigoni TaxID=1611254 RepID=A0A2G5U2X8_9PELO|nr:hypothetical protein B9Z55_013705 [Caenorhabditis nigoni]